MDFVFYEFKRFYELLENEEELIESISYEEKKNIFVIKSTMTKEYGYQKVEVIFKMYFYENMTRNEVFVINYVKVYHSLKSLYLIFRRLLHSFDLDDPLNGGINTFSIFLMIVGFLQKLENPALKRISECQINPDAINTSFKSIFSNSTRAREKCETSVNLSCHNTANNTSIGELFLNLIYFYAYSFDYQNLYLKPYVVESPNCDPVHKVT